MLFLVGFELYGLRGEVDVDYCNVRRVWEISTQIDHKATRSA